MAPKHIETIPNDDVCDQIKIDSARTPTPQQQLTSTCDGIFWNGQAKIISVLNGLGLKMCSLLAIHFQT